MTKNKDILPREVADALDQLRDDLLAHLRGGLVASVDRLEKRVDALSTIQRNDCGGLRSLLETLRKDLRTYIEALERRIEKLEERDHE